MTLFLLIFLCLSLLQIWFYRTQLHSCATHIKPLAPGANVVASWEFPKISVIIPAYNEVANIQDCVTAVLGSTNLSAEQLEVWVVDDQSTDATLAIVQMLQQTLADPRLHVLIGQPRPTDQPWTGKNWACAQAVKQARGELLLFIDADVRLKPGAIEAAVGTAQAEHIDLLSCLPGIVCDSWSEWLIQPLIFNAIATGFDLAVVNNPQTETAVAAGPFMLFRRSAYKQVGGHRGVAAEVLEDVELSRRIKHSGLKLHMAIGPELATVQMYPTWAALWEGWTKNLYSIFERNGWLTFYVALMMVIMYGVPSLGLALMVAKGWGTPLTPLDYLACSLALTAIVLQYDLRRLGEKITAIPTRYWWLGNLGGLLVAAIALASFIKTETGWGWTWRGRALSLPQFPVERYSSEPAISYFESPVVVDNLTEEVVKDK